MSVGEKGAEIAISFSIFDQNGQHRTIQHGQFAADDRAQSVFARGRAETRGAVKTVAIADGKGR